MFPAGAQIYDFPMGPVFGKAGTVTTLSVKPQCRFKVVNVFAQDTGNPSGNGSRVMQFLVGNRLQRPAAQGGTLAAFFIGNSARVGKTGGAEGFLSWDTCDLGQSIALTISFVQSCTVDLTLFGYAVI